MTAPPSKNSTIYRRQIAEACLTVSSAILRLNICAFSFLRKTEVAEANRTASVVFFIPPAVDPGEPPTSIKKIISKSPTSLIRPRFVVLKPAVLGVTA